MSSAPVRSRISLCSLDPLGIVAVHGEQNSSFFHSVFVALGFILWNPHAHQGCGSAAHYATGTGSSECTLDRTRRLAPKNLSQGNTGSDRVSYSVKLVSLPERSTEVRPLCSHHSVDFPRRILTRRKVCPPRLETWPRPLPISNLRKIRPWHFPPQSRHR